MQQTIFLKVKGISQNNWHKGSCNNNLKNISFYEKSFVVYKNDYDTHQERRTTGLNTYSILWRKNKQKSQGFKYSSSPGIGIGLSNKLNSRFTRMTGGRNIKTSIVGIFVDLRIFKEFPS